MVLKAAHYFIHDEWRYWLYSIQYNLTILQFLLMYKPNTFYIMWDKTFNTYKYYVVFFFVFFFNIFILCCNVVNIIICIEFLYKLSLFYGPNNTNRWYKHTVFCFTYSCNISMTASLYMILSYTEHWYLKYNKNTKKLFMDITLV